MAHEASTTAAALRPFRAGDEQALMRVCLETGDAGGDATGLLTRAPDLISEIFLLPYLVLAPDLATVVADEEPRGYVVGALDTALFEAEAERRWWPALRERYPSRVFPKDAPESMFVYLLHHRPVVAPDLLARYPSHLHIDLLPAVQGSGFGRRLLEHLVGQLADRGSPGLHLGVSDRNTRAIAFYEALGFRRWSSGHGSHTMVLDL